MEIYCPNSFELSKEECNTIHICSILDSTQVSEDDNVQLNFEDIIHLGETKENEAPKLELYLGDQQTYPVVVSPQLTIDQEEKNVKNYKERMRIFHDKHIMTKSFTPGQKVILFNSSQHLFPSK